MSNRNGICFAEAHKSCQFFPNSMAHGPTSLPSTFSVATGNRPLTRFSAVFITLRCYRQVGYQSQGNSDIILTQSI